MKKLLSILLVVLMIGAVVLPALAITPEEVPAKKSETLDVWVENAVLDSGTNTAETTLNVSNNPGFWALTVIVMYPKYLSLGAANALDVTPSSTDQTISGEKTEPNSRFKEVCKELGLDADATLNGRNFVMTYIENGAGNGWDTDFEDDGVLQNLTFTYDETKNTEADGVAEVEVLLYDCCHAENSEYPDGDEVALRASKGLIGLGKGGGNTDPTISVSDVTVNEGEDVSVPIYVENNPGVYAIAGLMTYPQGLAFKSWTEGDIFARAEFFAIESSLHDVLFSEQTQKTLFKKYINLAAEQGADVTDALTLKLNAENTDLTQNNTKNGRFVTVTFSSTGIKPGTYPICFVQSPSDTNNVEMEDIHFLVSNATLTVVGTACEHDYQETAKVESTCTTAGYIERTCSKCGDLQKEDLPLADHTFVFFATVAPTCLDEGYDDYICPYCSTHDKRNTQPALGHDMQPDAENSVDPTCLADGVDAFKCSRCGATETKPVNALGHDYQITGTSGSCGEVGKTTYTCSRCGDIKEVEGEVIEHLYKVVDEKAPTCLDDGYTTYECSKCGDTYTDTQTALGHDMQPDAENSVDPKCLADGVDAFKCSRCGATETKPVAALGHDWKLVSTTPADCLNAGSNDYKCSRCDETKSDPIPALGHDPVVIPAVAPTCTDDGATEGSKCARCGAILEEPKVDPKLGHLPEEIPAVAPTCTDDGTKAGSKCARCGAILEEPAVDPKLGHDPEEIPAVAPTCLVDGSTAGSKCKRCGAILEAPEVIPAPGHEFEVVDETAPTCTDAGKKLLKCKVCEAEKEEVLPALDHDWDDGKIVKEATYEEDGLIVYTCKRCALQKEEIIPKLVKEEEKNDDKKDDKKDDKTDKTGDKKDVKTDDQKAAPAANNGNKQTGDNMTLVVFIALVCLVSGAAVVVTKKKLFR